MKKIFICTLSVALLTVGLSSCGKSSKGKMASEWKVTEYNDNSTSTQTNGSKTNSTTVISGTTETETTVVTPNGQPSTTSVDVRTVNAYTYTIEKDGTWTSTKDWTFVETIGNAPFETVVTTKRTKTTSGTWAFVGKTKGDDFKKNERVLFNVLTESYTNVETEAGEPSTTTSSSYTYKTGEVPMLFTVKESSKKELQLEHEFNNTSTQSNGTSSTVGTTTITLSAN